MTMIGTAPASLTIILFGPMQVLIEGKPLPRLRSRKALWLLALLALRPGRPVEREWLAGTLWPDMDTDQAFASMRPVLSDLRKALGGQSERMQSPNRYSLLLDCTDADVDLLAFDAAIKSNQPAALERAVTLYQGPLLEGCAEEWVGQDRIAREQDCLRALGTLAQTALAEGNYGRAIGYFRRAVGLDPWGEAARRGLMEALAQSGDSNEALHVYREFVELLRDDPKAVPDEETSTLYARLRARQKAASLTSAPVPPVLEPALPIVRGQIPHPLTGITGREDERFEVAVRLRRSRLVTLTGMGGIGKTRLAIEVAHEVVREFPGGVWLVSLETLGDGAQVAAQTAGVFGLKEAAEHPPLRSLTEHLRAERALLVLDNCEHLLKEVAQFARHLLQECAGLRILATSREALGITGEVAWAVPSLTTPDLAHLPPQGSATLQRVLPAYESVQLFVERAQSVRRDFVLTQSNASIVAQVCSRLEGIPLAIEIAAAWVKAMTIEQVAARLEDRLGLLTGGSRAAQSRQQTLRATLDWSYDLLGQTERLLLGRLSVFAGGCDIEAAESVCAGEGVEARQVLDSMSSLVDKSLVVFEERQESIGRYRLLEMVRQYAARRLLEDGDLDRTKTRHLNWYMTLAERVVPYLKEADQAVWLERLETEHDNLRAALNWSEGNAAEAESGLRLAGALWHYWYVRGHYQDAWRYLKRTLERPETQAATAARAKALNGAGTMAYSQSDFSSACAYFEEALGVRRHLADKPGLARTLVYLGNTLRMLGEVDSTRELYQESLNLSHELGDKNSVAWTTFNLAGLAHEQGEADAADAGFNESLRFFQELGEMRGVAWSLIGLGELLGDHGNYVQAREWNAESHRLFTELGDKQGIAWATYNLGGMVSQQRQFDSAQSIYEEALRLMTELGDRRGIAFSLNGLGRLACDRGEFASAGTLLREGLSLSRELGEQRSIAYSLLCMGITASSQGDYREAQRSLEESLGRAGKLGDKRGMGEALLHLANLDLSLKDYPMARTHFADSLTILGPLGHKALIADCLQGLTLLMLAQGAVRRSVGLWGSVATLRESFGAASSAPNQMMHDQLTRQARAALGDEAFAAAWNAGCAMTWEKAAAYALDDA